MNRHAATSQFYFPAWRSVLSFAGITLFASLAYAEPSGGQVSGGTGTIAQAGATTTITQQSQNLAIDWNTFSIAANESVSFIQPNTSAIALNRILGSSPSQIFGNLSANGQVFILNPNGVLFGRGAQVNVGGLVATTLSLSNADFMAGNYRFSKGGSAGSVVNQGTLTAADGGYIALLAAEVRNEGVIIATLGTALLAAGDTVTLNLDNGSLLGYSIDQGALNALAENKQLIQADGGLVVMSAKAADALSTAVVNNTGIIEARTIQNQGGVIKLLGDMQAGQVNVGGTLDASAPDGGNGGFIETSAAQVQVADTAHITTAAANGENGTWLIDPFDFNIAATGGNITGATLSTSLGAGNVVIQSTSGTAGTAGNVNVNDVVSWSANMLTLNAQNNININANLNGSGTAQLAFEYGQSAFAAGNASSYVIAPNVQINLPSGNNFSTKLGSDGVVKNHTVITGLGAENSTTSSDLQGMNGNLAGNYVLGSNIDATATSTWNAGAGFAPIGDNSTTTTASQFTGSFDGLGHTISNLVINRPATSYVGLFGFIAPGSSVRNVGLVGGSVIGNSEVGGLAGFSSGSVNNAYNTGTVSGGSSVVGGLVGYSNGSIRNSYATGSVSGINYIGGLVGTNYGAVIASHAGGIVSGNNYIGGLVGINLGATISNSYATGNVSGASLIGGLVGQNDEAATISGSYATGSVGSASSTHAGGLVGINYGAINTSYATGSVSGINYIGGLVGYNTSTIDTTYATGSVSGSTHVGGLAGFNDSTGIISSSYWDTDTTLQTSGIGTDLGLNGISTATGLTTAQMRVAASFAAWNIANTGGAGAVWRIYDGYTTPLLSSFLQPLLIVTANNASKAYDGAPYSGGNGVTYSDSNAAINTGGIITYGGSSQGAVNTGDYDITASGLYSLQQGYDIIAYMNGTLTVTPSGQTATALGSNALELAYNTAQLGIAKTTVTGNQIEFNGELINIVGCGVLMPPDTPTNTCQN